MLIRRATPADASAAAAVIAGALAEFGLPFDAGDGGRDADVATFGSKRESDDFVADDGGDVLGVVSVGPHGDPGVAWISKLFVVSRARGRGVGRALLHAAHDAARGRGMREVGLRSRVVFRAALALYAAEGYVARDFGPRIESGDVVLFRPL